MLQKMNQCSKELGGPAHGKFRNFGRGRLLCGEFFCYGSTSPASLFSTAEHQLTNEMPECLHFHTPIVIVNHQEGLRINGWLSLGPRDINALPNVNR